MDSRELFMEGPMTAAELAAELEVSGTQASRILSNLKRDNHIRHTGQRISYESKGRVFTGHLYELTAVGRAFAKKKLLQG